VRLFVLRNGKKITIAKKVRIADSAFKRFKGLMLERKENFDYALVFLLPNESRYGASIHSLFMRFPIDVVFLDNGKKIVDLVKGFKPWSLNLTPKKPAGFIVEMREGSIKKFRLENGEKISFS